MTISEVTEVELRGATDQRLRQEMQELVRPFNVILLNAEMRGLARHYLDGGIFPPAAVNDALHVACAVVSRLDLLVSWNFRHLVNRRCRAMINEVNVARGHPPIDIVAPPEV